MIAPAPTKTRLARMFKAFFKSIFQPNHNSDFARLKNFIC
jgi:hypothetical protein